MAIDYDSFRADIGDMNGAFSEAEIDVLFERGASAYGESVAEQGARVLAVTQLIANAAKLSDYTANDSSDKKSQVFKHLKELRQMYKRDLDDAIEGAALAAGGSFRAGRTVKKPARLKEYPDA